MKSIFTFLKKLSTKLNQKNTLASKNLDYQDILNNHESSDITFTNKVTYLSRNDIRINSFNSSFKNNWDNAEKLYELIAQAYQEGFYSILISPTIQLIKIAENKIQATYLAACVMFKNNRFEYAHSILEDCIANHGYSSNLLVLYAKCLTDPQKIKLILWQALELQPNIKEAVDWWLDIKEQAEGKQYYIEHLNELAKIPDSWLAQLYLADCYMKQKNVKKAFNIYESLAAQHLDNIEFCYYLSGNLIYHLQYQWLVNFLHQKYEPKKYGVLIGIHLLLASCKLADFRLGSKLIKEIKPFIEEANPEEKDQFFQLENHINIKTKNNQHAFWASFIGIISIGLFTDSITHGSTFSGIAIIFSFCKYIFFYGAAMGIVNFVNLLSRTKLNNTPFSYWTIFIVAIFIGLIDIPQI